MPPIRRSSTTGCTAKQFAKRLLLSGAVLLLHACILTREAAEDEPAVPAQAANAALLAAVQLIGGGVGAPPQRILTGLDSAEATANVQELYAIKRMRPLVERLLAPAASLSAKDYGDAANVLNLLAKDHPDDFAWQLATVTSLDFIYTVLQANPTQAASPEEAGAGAPYAVARALELAGRFPAQAQAHAHLAQVLAASGGDLRSAMLSYRRCLQLDPRSAPCQSGLQLLATEYSKPRCREFRPEAIGVHRASATAKAGSRQVVVGAQILFMDAAAILTGADLNEVTESGGVTTLTLTPTGAARYEAVTAELAPVQAFVVIEIGGIVHSAPRVLSPVSSGQLTVASNAFDSHKLCRVFDHHELPAEVQDMLHRRAN